MLGRRRIRRRLDERPDLVSAFTTTNGVDEFIELVKHVLGVSTLRVMPKDDGEKVESNLQLIRRPITSHGVTGIGERPPGAYN